MSFEKWNAAHGSFDLDQRNREFSAWEAGRAESEAELVELEDRHTELGMRFIALCAERDALREALRAGHEIVSSAYAHVSHGGPTREEAGAWIDKAAVLLYPVASGEPARKP